LYLYSDIKDNPYLNNFINNREREVCHTPKD
jgi:hypothetical protein